MRTNALALVLAAALATTLPAGRAAASVSFSVTIEGFHDELAPYGTWVDCAYGEAWVPRVSARWAPYTDGEWVYTRYGWTWAADDPWGGDPYHYGTWVYLAGYGWAWVPGTVWAPAWVTWCYSDDWIGWAPLPPEMAFGVSGYSGRPIVLPATRYVFVPTTRFVGTNVSSVRVDPSRNATLFRQARPVTRFDVSGGVVRNVALPVSTVQRATGRRIVPREIRAARTAPRTLEASGLARHGRVAVVAPAREIRSTRAFLRHSVAQAERRPHAPREVRHEETSPRVRQPHAQRSEPRRPEEHALPRPAARHEASRPGRPGGGEVRAVPRRERPRAHQAPSPARAPSVRMERPAQRPPARVESGHGRPAQGGGEPHGNGRGRPDRSGRR